MLQLITDIFAANTFMLLRLSSFNRSLLLAIALLQGDKFMAFINSSCFFISPVFYYCSHTICRHRQTDTAQIDRLTKLTELYY